MMMFWGSVTLGFIATFLREMLRKVLNISDDIIVAIAMINVLVSGMCFYVKGKFFNNLDDFWKSA